MRLSLLRLASALSVLTALLSVVACGGGSSSDSSVVTSDTTRVVLSGGGAYPPATPEGSTCDGTGESYTVDLRTSTLAYSYCNTQPPAWQQVTGTLSLDASDLAAVKTLLASIHAVAAGKYEGCADCGSESIVVTRSGTSTTYFEDDNGAPESAAVADGVSDALEAVRQLVDARLGVGVDAGG
jgi:hypothetical protein